MVQVIADTQPAIAVQAEHARSVVPPQAALMYCPATHAPEQAAQLSATPLTRKVPTPHDAHCSSVGELQLRPPAQPAIGVHALHTRGVVALHPALSY